MDPNQEHAEELFGPLHEFDPKRPKPMRLTPPEPPPASPPLLQLTPWRVVWALLAGSMVLYKILSH